MAPFKDSLELNIEALKENIRFIMDGGISNGKGHIICPCGTGEYVTLSPEENRMMVKAAVEVAGNKLLVVAGVSGVDYREVIKLAHNAVEAGAKCVMIPPPYYYEISQEGVYKWYKVIAEEIKVGIMAYSQPWRNIGAYTSVSVMGKLADIENMVCMKYGGGKLRDFITALGLYQKRFSFIDNSLGSTATVAHMHGASGYITGPGAFWPEFEAKYWNLLEQGKYQEADKWHAKIAPFWEFFFSEGGIFFAASVLKAGLEYRGLYGGPVRLPSIELTKEQKKKLFGVLEGIGVPKKR
jgi:4-hydroxy-tetrahydrodipicolinate synthase